MQRVADSESCQKFADDYPRGSSAGNDPDISSHLLRRE